MATVFKKLLFAVLAFSAACTQASDDGACGGGSGAGASAGEHVDSPAAGGGSAWADSEIKKGSQEELCVGPMMRDYLGVPWLEGVASYNDFKDFSAEEACSYFKLMTSFDAYLITQPWFIELRSAAQRESVINQSDFELAFEKFYDSVLSRFPDWYKALFAGYVRCRLEVCVNGTEVLFFQGSDVLLETLKKTFNIARGVLCEQCNRMSEDHRMRRNLCYRLPTCLHSICSKCLVYGESKETVLCPVCGCQHDSASIHNHLFSEI